jgi:NAD(P)-dependent dehydrogenase (short-subunit alcohol dehydrogenase family)
MDLKGKTVMIAGATGGLGQAVAIQLAELGCSMMLVHHGNNERAEKLRTQLKQQAADVWFYSCDFTSADDINDATEIFFDQAKSPYALINLIGDPARVDWQKAQINQMQESFLKNASAPLHSAKIFALKLREKSIGGAIVLFSSMQGIYPFESSLYYGTPKAALIHGAKILAKDFGGEPFIRINVIAPGVNQAGMAEESIQKGKYQKLVDQKIIPRYGDASSIGCLVTFLLDPQLYMTGQTLLYDGGLTLRRDLLR